jgi:hypothetical protein
MQVSVIPEFVLRGLEGYRDNRWPVGRFLTAVLENDLAGAVLAADPASLAAIHSIVMWVYWEIPHYAWGSRENVTKWLEAA